MTSVTTATSLYNKQVSLLKNTYDKKGQGAVRNSVGKLYEDLCYHILNKIDPSLKIVKNDYLTVYSKSKKYKIKNIQVDWHVYKDNELVLIIECKTYLDVCYLKRAIDDFETIRKVKKDIPSIIFAGQNAVGKNAWGYYSEEYNFDTFFVNTTKKRNSKKPIYKTCDPIDANEIRRFEKHVKNIIQR